MTALIHLFALLVPLSFVPAAVFGYRNEHRGRILSLLLLGAAFVNVAWFYLLAQKGWVSGFSGALWTTVTLSSILFAGLSFSVKALRQQAVLFCPYMILLSVIAVAWLHASAFVNGASYTMTVWLALHIVFTTMTYALLSIAAVTALAVMLKERALKAKTTSRLSAVLPPVVSSEKLQKRLLIAAELLLAAGIASGMAYQYETGRQMIALDHKSLLAWVVFFGIAALLMVEALWGVRGRRASRLILFVYLVATLGFPGVKFVSDILLA